MNKLLKKKMLIISITLAFLILILYVSYAYYNAEISGNESVSTVAVNGGFINIDYVNNSGTITAANIIPGWETTKSFTVSSSTNFTDPSLLNNTWYDVLLVVDQNDFVTGSLEYMLTIAEEDENKEGIYKNSEYYSIPTGTNLDGIVLGSGYLPDVNVSHTYNLTLRYIDSDDIDQTTDMYAKFYARVNVRGSDIATVTFDLDGGTLNNFSINEQSKSRIAKNTKVYIPVPVKEDYTFVGWKVVSGDVGTINNVITTNLSDIKLKALWQTNSPYEFDYTGGEQEFIAEHSGYYKIETWGAQGGNSDAIGGYGGYSVGNILLNSNDKIYIYVGGHPTSYEGGFNGGGSASENSQGRGGGGATHISKENGVLSLQALYAGILNSPILIVAGGGGGACGFACTAIGGHAGGFVGSKGNGYESGAYGLGGTQVSGGQNSNSNTDFYGSFGQGGKCRNEGGGGGGYYGGGGTHSDNGGSGGGGSGFIGNPLLIDKYMYCYNCETSDVESTRTYSTTCAEETPTENCAKVDNGYARITYLHN